MHVELNDTITRDGEEYPAYVYSTSSAGEALEYTDIGTGYPRFVGFSLVETVRAIVNPGTSWQVNDEIVWDGRQYYVSYIARRKDLDGMDHHTTLTLQIAG